MGSNELNKGVVQIKDLELGSRISSHIKKVMRNGKTNQLKWKYQGKS